MNLLKWLFCVLSFFATTVFGYTNNGYPYTLTSGCGGVTAQQDAYGFYQNNCTSYAAYMMRTFGINFSNGYRSAHWGNARNWDNAAGNISGPDILVDRNPLPGDIAYWDNLSDSGHVAFVEKVHFDASGNALSVDVTEYNFSPSCNWSTRTIPVGNPDGYIHILAFNEGLVGTHYMNCYEMGNICSNQTSQEWRWIVERVEQYRCKNCNGAFQEIADAFYGPGGFGGSETSGPDPITGTNSSGSKPDLTIIELSLEDAAHNPITRLHINDSARCRMRIKNVGKANAGPFQTSCYISQGLKTDNNPVDVGKEDTQGLSVGSTHTEHEDFSLEYPGWYNMMACADSGRQVIESNENNQCKKEVPFEVWSNPDIVVTSVALGGGKTSLIPNEVFSVDTVVTNAGENFGKTILIGYYLDGALIGTDQIKRENLKGGVSKIESLSSAVAPGTLGNHTVMVCADIGNRIPEVNKANNCSSLPVTVVSPNAPPNPAPKKTTPAVLQLLLD